MDRQTRVAKAVALLLQMAEDSEKVPQRWEELDEEDRGTALTIARGLVDIVDALREAPRPPTRVRHGRTA